MQKHICEICQKEFKTGNELGSHKRTHTRKLIECDICQKKFGALRLEKHKISCEEKELLSQKQCEKCGKDFKSYSSRFCSRSCANSHTVSEEQKSKTSKSLKNRETEAFLLNRRPKHCKYCGKSTYSLDNKKTKIVCVPSCVESKKSLSQKLSLSLCGKTGGYREKGGRGKGCLYKGVWLDSSWELSLAKRLDELSIRWERDTGKHRFNYIDIKGKERKYYPDFFIPCFNLYIEVKGYWTDETRHKMTAVKERHKHIKILVLESLKEIETFKILSDLSES